MLSEPLVKLNSVYVKVQESLLHLRGDLLVGDTGVVGKAVGGTARIFDATAFYAQQVRQILRKFGTDAHLFVPGPGVPILGPELAGSTFANAAGWSFSGGVLTASSATAFSTASNSGFLGVQMGKSYQVTYTANVTSGSARLQFVGGTAYNSTYATASGTFSEVYVPSENKAVINVQAGASGFTGTISGLTVREILGYTNYLNGFAAGNYLESTGNTNASVDGAVGLVLDAAGSVGAELVVNGDFAAGLVGWTPVASGDNGTAVINGRLVINRTATGGTWQSFPTSPGKSYLATSIIKGGTSAATFRVVDSVYNGTLLVDSPAVAAGSGDTTVQAVFTALSTTSVFYARVSAGIGGTAEFDNISVRELPGTHASQSTTANKPTLRRGIVNLQQQSNTLATAGWALNNSASVLNYAEAGVGGTLSASRVTSAALVNSGCYSYGATLPQNATVTQAAVVKLVSGASTSCKLGADNNNGFIVINPQTMTITSVGSAVTASSAASLGGGYYLFAWSFVQPATQSAMVVYNNAAVTLTLAVDGTGQFVGTLTAQQILAAGGIPLTTTAPASSQYGAYAWQFDGTDDRLILSSVPFQVADDHCIVVSGKAGATGADRTLFSLANSGNHQLPWLKLSASGAVECAYYDGSTFAGATSLQVGPSQFVASVRNSSGTAKLRLNSAEVSQGMNVSGMQAASATSASIGAFNGGALFFNGNIYAVLVIKGTVSDSDLKTLEKWIGSLAGVSIA